jgi:hypothetical protein
MLPEYNNTIDPMALAEWVRSANVNSVGMDEAGLLRFD